MYGASTQSRDLLYYGQPFGCGQLNVQLQVILSGAWYWHFSFCFIDSFLWCAPVFSPMFLLVYGLLCWVIPHSILHMHQNSPFSQTPCPFGWGWSGMLTPHWQSELASPVLALCWRAFLKRVSATHKLFKIWNSSLFSFGKDLWLYCWVYTCLMPWHHLH